MKSLKSSASRTTPFLSFVPPGVVVPDFGCLEARKFVLDLLFGRVLLPGLRMETRDEERERIEGVVGADLPSIYEYELKSGGMASGSERGSRDVNGTRDRWFRFV